MNLRKRTLALLLTVCMLLSVMVPMASAEAETLTYIFSKPANSDNLVSDGSSNTLTLNTDFQPEGANAAWQYAGRYQKSGTVTTLNASFLQVGFNKSASTSGWFAAIRIRGVEATTYTMSFTNPANTLSAGKSDIFILNDDVAYETEAAASAGILAAIQAGSYTNIGTYDSMVASTTQNFTHTFTRSGNFTIVFSCTSGQTASKNYMKVASLVMTPVVTQSNVASNGGTEYGTVQAAINAAAAEGAEDKTVKLIDNVTEDVEIPEGVTLDLNGKTLTATDFECKEGGILADSSDGDGRVATRNGKTVNVAATDLLLYDSREDSYGYRVYNGFQIEAKLREIDDDTKQLWIKLTFTKKDAYKVIATGNSEIEIGAAMNWAPTGGTAKDVPLSFDNSWEEDWGTKMQTAENYGFYIQFTGFETLAAGTLTLTPMVNAVSISPITITK